MQLFLKPATELDSLLSPMKQACIYIFPGNLIVSSMFVG